MPFTVSHAAAVVPFARRPFVLSALVIGSMSPDVLYYIPFVPNHPVTHSLPGLFVFALPVSLALLFAYHRWLEPPLVSLLPAFVRRRLPDPLERFSFGPPARFGWIVVSILLGALTHIVWDSFTHGNGFVVQRVPELTRVVSVGVVYETPLYNLLQHASTVVGGLIVMAWCAWRLARAKPIRRAPPADGTSARSSGAGLTMLCGAAATTGLLYGALHLPEYGFRAFVVQTAIGGVTAFAAFWLLYSVAWHATRRRKT